MDMNQVIEFAGNHPILSAAAVAVVALLIGTEIARRFRGFKEIAPAEVVKLMNHEEAVVLDVRDKGDYRAGHIVGAQNAPLAQLAERVQTLATDLAKPVIAYCASGMQAPQAAKQLKDKGYTSVYALRGGLSAWRAENLPVSLKKS